MVVEQPAISDERPGHLLREPGSTSHDVCNAAFRDNAKALSLNMCLLVTVIAKLFYPTSPSFLEHATNYF